jgi:hypothetical protein
MKMGALVAEASVENADLIWVWVKPWVSFSIAGRLFRCFW